MPYFDVTATNIHTGRKNKKRYKASGQVHLRTLAEADGLELLNCIEVHPQPATDRQIAYARDLGLTFPHDITVDEMAHLISRAVDEDVITPDWVLEWALSQFPDERGLMLSRYKGLGALLNFLMFRHGERKDVESSLRVWVIAVAAHVYRIGWRDPIEPQIPTGVLGVVISTLAADAKALSSVKKCSPEKLAHFGSYTDREGYARIGASTRSYAYEITCEMLLKSKS